jgi:hypothetical protein
MKARNSFGIHAITTVVTHFALIASAQIVQNGGFEVPQVGSSGFTYKPSGAVWNFGGGGSGAGIVNSSCTMFCDVPSGLVGSQAAVLQNATEFSQTIAFPESSIYRLTYLHGGRGYNGPSNYGGNQHYAVLLDGAFLAADLATTNNQPFRPVALTFFRYAGPAVLKFQGKDTGFDNTAFIDEVAITLVDTNATIQAIYNAVEICWPSSSTNRYQVQWTSSNSTNWTDLGNPMQGTGTNMCIFDSTRYDAKRFYRVVTITQ